MNLHPQAALVTPSYVAQGFFLVLGRQRVEQEFGQDRAGIGNLVEIFLGHAGNHQQRSRMNLGAAPADAPGCRLGEQGK